MLPNEEKRVEQRLADFKAAAAASPGADKAALAIAALEAAQLEDCVSQKNRRWAYLISIGLPPLGLLWAGWYYFSVKSDGKRVALICVILTVIGGLLAWITIAVFVASMPHATLNQLENLNSADINSILQQYQ